MFAQARKDLTFFTQPWETVSEVAKEVSHRQQEKVKVGGLSARYILFFVFRYLMNLFNEFRLLHS
jgi:hypothetical protein